jgi:hypothetical protein
LEAAVKQEAAMAAISLKDFDSNLGMMLRDECPGTTADLTDLVVAYLSGRVIVYAYLRDDGAGLVEEEFDPEDLVWDEWREQFSVWLGMPRFTYRQEVAGWLMDAPPFDQRG